MAQFCAAGSASRKHCLNRNSRKMMAERCPYPWISSSFRHMKYPNVLCRASSSDHSEYMKLAGINEGNRVVIDLVHVLQAKGDDIMDPSDREDIHPLLIPLTKGTNGNIKALLRWPKAVTTQQLPVVETTAAGSGRVNLLARSTNEFIHRMIAEEDFNNQKISDRPIAEAAGEHGLTLYTAGDAEASGLPSLNAYLTRKAGMYCDVCESLVQSHLDKNDSMSALITAEWYMREGNFPGWGRPYEFVFDLMLKMGRAEESRDIARLALRMPWWSLHKGFTHARDMAGLSGNADAIRAVLLEQEEMANGGITQGKFKTNPKTKQQICIEEASHLMNKASAGELKWSDIRPQLVDEYEKAGMHDVSRFIAII